MPAYYNEIDPFAAAWLRELIASGHIAPGEVDERSIVDVRPSDLAGYTQCHFFAGIGVWSYALRRAGWPDDRPVWTGSCPCQPFSSAGKGGGFDDERHLWPAWHWLIEQHRPHTIFGEQVASRDGLAWLDLVAADMDGTGYALGVVDSCAAGFGAPHIRQRLYWMSHAASGWEPIGWRRKASVRWEGAAGSDGSSGGLAEPLHAERRALRLDREDGCDGSNGGRTKTHGLAGACGEVRGRWPGSTNGLWRDADWLLCRDGKWRPVEPGTFPLAHGAPVRVGRLRGYGNAINAAQAQAFIEAAAECLECLT